MYSSHYFTIQFMPPPLIYHDHHYYIITVIYYYNIITINHPTNNHIISNIHQPKVYTHYPCRISQLLFTLIMFISHIIVIYNIYTYT